MFAHFCLFIMTLFYFSGGPPASLLQFYGNFSGASIYKALIASWVAPWEMLM